MQTALSAQLFYHGSSGMLRSDVISEISRRDVLIVANIGYPARELFDAADRTGNFYMLGSMGLASSIGLGLAVSQPQRVCVIDGDGSVLMNLGSLATIAHHAPDNFCLVIVDNKAYGSTGGQPTYTCGKTDLAAVARGAGNKNVVHVATIAELSRALDEHDTHAAVILADAEPGNQDVPVISLSPVEIKERFMAHLLKGKH
jgi:sulfopyruvate decarboxylase subunit beta